MPSVKWEDRSVKMFYCPEFPLELLRYKDLWEKDELGRPWRDALRKNIAKYGMKSPLLVWNHHLGNPHLSHLSKKPYLLRTGRNRLWAIVSLGWTHAHAIVTGSCEFDCTELRSEDEILEHWPDGDLVIDKEGVWAKNKIDPRRMEYNW